MEPLRAYYGELATPEACGPRAVGRYCAPMEPLWTCVTDVHYGATMGPLWRASQAKSLWPTGCGPLDGSTLEPLWSQYVRRSLREPRWSHYADLAKPRASGPEAVGHWLERHESATMESLCS